MRKPDFNLIISVFVALLFTRSLQSQTVTSAWTADLGDGRYQNPVVHADYSDPDAIRVGQNYYLVASSFHHSPALPILQSRDLVNWTLIGHALQRQVPEEHFSQVRRGNGVWAPSIRYHHGEFYVYYPDPDFGIYLVKAKNINGPWAEPVLVAGGKGLIDPCPLWDDDGTAYLVHAYAGSRAGIKSLLVIRKMNAAGTRTLDEGRIVYDGHDADATVEGPKLYKRNGYYYIIAPAGGVTQGWQIVLRSRTIYGPYERKIVLAQGHSGTNGPHQGAWVATSGGENWFLHFQDKDAYGRILHLQPMEWKNDWPVIGVDPDGDGTGEPVASYRKPGTGMNVPISAPAESDEFNGIQPGLQWQWQANPKAFWSFLVNGNLRLYSVPLPDSSRNYWTVPNVLTQKFPAETFQATTSIRFKPRLDGERSGLIVMGLDYASLSLCRKSGETVLIWSTCRGADRNQPEQTEEKVRIQNSVIYLRVEVRAQAVCQFSYSVDGGHFTEVGEPFRARPGRWTGAELGLFCTRTQPSNDSGFAEFDWFRISPSAAQP